MGGPEPFVLRCCDSTALGFASARLRNSFHRMLRTMKQRTVLDVGFADRIASACAVSRIAAQVANWAQLPLEGVPKTSNRKRRKEREDTRKLGRIILLQLRLFTHGMAEHFDE